MTEEIRKLLTIKEGVIVSNSNVGWILITGSRIVDKMLKPRIEEDYSRIVHIPK